MTTLMPPEHLRAEAAERLLVGDVLRDPDMAVDAALRHVAGPQDFYDFGCGVVFGVARDLYTTAKVGGPMDVYQELVRRGQGADVGGAAWLVEAWEACPTAANAAYHASQVRDAALRRKLWRLAQRHLRDAEAPPTGTAEEVIAGAAKQLQDLADDAAGRSSSVVPLSRALREAMTEIDRRVADPDRRPGLATGFPALDAVLGGLRPGQLVIVGARPGIGKSALLLAVLANVAAGGDAGYLASLEMPRSELSERLLSMGSGVRLHAIRSGRLDERDQHRLIDAVGPGGYGGSAEVFVDDTPSVTAAKFGATTRTLVRRQNVKLVALDYLQLLLPADRNENRVLQVGRMSRDLKMIARECGVPVVAAAQLSREVEGRTDGKPKLSDLRDSGEIEQNADVVIFLHASDPRADGDTRPTTATVAKNRNGPSGIEVPLAYRRSVVKFETAAVGY
jgi:replicative DNA helicase